MKKFLVVAGIVLAALILTAGTFSAGFIAGHTMNAPTWLPTAYYDKYVQPGLLPGLPSAQADNGTPQDLQELFKPFWQSWDLVKGYYVDQPVNQEIMMRGAIRGMMESLGDQHTSYLDPEMFKVANTHLEGQEYEGIGAWVDITGEYLTIISPMPGSPSEKAGLKPNDKIIAIDGVDMTGLDGEAVRQKVLGPKGSVVTLTIQREGVEKPIDVKVTRDSIVVPMVSGRMLDNNIAYVQLYTFGNATAPELKDTLSKLLDQHPTGLILDLRNNGGGYLDTAIDVVSQFVDKGIVMQEVYGDGRVENYESKGGGLATQIPMAVLMNKGSASASEIVAGALQDLGRAYLVGVTSYGKGSVQSYTQLVNNEGAVRVTIARWLTPKGRQINEVGLSPDFPIELTQQNILDGKDTQLDKAVEVLTNKLIPPPTPVPSPTPVLTPTPTP
jgi:carboxyl-terminal processing protease